MYECCIIKNVNMGKSYQIVLKSDIYRNPMHFLELNWDLTVFLGRLQLVVRANDTPFRQQAKFWVLQLPLLGIPQKIPPQQTAAQLYAT